MTGLLIVFRSVTFAQRTKKVLERKGITATIVRPSIEFTERSCGYAVKISESYLPEALDSLKKYDLCPAKFVLVKDGQYRELKI